MARGDLAHPFVNFPNAATRFQLWWYFVQNTNIADWVFSVTGGSAPTAVLDGPGGGLVLTSGTADNDKVLAQSDGEFVRLNGLGKTYDFLFRAKLGEDTQADYGLGIGVRDTDWLGDAAGLSDGIFLRKRDGVAVWDLVIAKDAASFPADYTAINGIAAADEVEHTFALRIVTDPNTLGTGRVSVWVDGVLAVNAVQVTTLPHDEDLTVMYGVKNGDATATDKLLTIYEIAVNLER